MCRRDGDLPTLEPGITSVGEITKRIRTGRATIVWPMSFRISERNHASDPSDHP